MEQSAYEALMIGVYVFVFIIALTASILLMSNVMDMVNYANNRASVGMNGTLAETVGIVDERIYTGAQLLTYYREEKERQELEKQELKYKFNVSDGNGETSLANYVETTSINNYLNEKFILKYKEKQSEKDVYVFVKHNDVNEEGQG